MEAPTPGQIDCRGVPSSRSVRKFVEKRINQWFVLVRNETTPPSYTVSFWREGDGHIVNCQIQIRTPNGVWRAAQYGSGLHQALLKAIQQLMLLPPQLATSPLR